MKVYFFLPQSWQLLAQGCENQDIDLKFKIGGHFDTILMCVKFGDDHISTLDFSFIGGKHTLKFYFLPKDLKKLSDYKRKFLLALKGLSPVVTNVFRSIELLERDLFIYLFFQLVTISNL